jgi:hypothetical protein
VALVLVLPAALLAALSVRDHPGHDYLAIHAAARLLASGEDPYDVGALFRVQQPLKATDPVLYGRIGLIPYYYPPWLALACVPLTALSFPVAKVVWVYLSYQALVLAGQGLRELPGLPSQTTIVLGLLAVPACLAAHMGQTSALVLLLLVVAWRLIERGSDWWAGVALAWLTFKPQLTVVVVPAVLIWSGRRGRWGVTRGFAAMLGLLCLGCALVVPSWPRDMLLAPRLSPLPTTTNPSDGVTWLSVLRTLGLERWPLALGYAAAALPMAAMALGAAWNRTRPCSDAIALGVVSAFFVSSHSLAYDFAILLFPMMAFLPGLSVRVAVRLLITVTLAFNLHFALTQGGATRLSLVTLFWLPAGLAIFGVAREAGVGQVRFASSRQGYPPRVCENLR